MFVLFHVALILLAMLLVGLLATLVFLIREFISWFKYRW